MQAGGYAKGGEGMKWDFEDVKTSLTFFNNVYSGMDLGSKVPESKVTIDISTHIWTIKPGEYKPSISKTIQKDTTVNLKDAATVRYKNAQANASRYWDATRTPFGPK